MLGVNWWLDYKLVYWFIVWYNAANNMDLRYAPDILNTSVQNLNKLSIEHCRAKPQSLPHVNNSVSAPHVIIICDIYIVPYSARSCSKALYNIIHNLIIPDSDLFPPSTNLNSQYNACCHYRRKASLKLIATASCQVLILWMSEPVATWRHCSSRSLEPATVWLRVLRSN